MADSAVCLYLKEKLWLPHDQTSLQGEGENEQQSLDL